MWKLVKEFIQSCDTCTSGKVPQYRPYGLLHLLPVPKDPWLLLSMDFFIDLPLTNGKDSIFVVIDWLTKMAHFISCNKIITWEETAKLFLDKIYCIHGYCLRQGYSIYFQFLERIFSAIWYKNQSVYIVSSTN
jgi:hypothetical protein